jgi:hypothetical protein
MFTFPLQVPQPLLILPSHQCQIHAPRIPFHHNQSLAENLAILAILSHNKPKHFSLAIKTFNCLIQANLLNQLEHGVTPCCSWNVQCIATWAHTVPFSWNKLPVGLHLLQFLLGYLEISIHLGHITLQWSLTHLRLKHVKATAGSVCLPGRHQFNDGQLWSENFPHECRHKGGKVWEGFGKDKSGSAVRTRVLRHRCLASVTYCILLWISV